jgi:hypothetical protein
MQVKGKVLINYQINFDTSKADKSVQKRVLFNHHGGILFLLSIFISFLKI